MGIRGRRERLERRLEAERPQPPDELVSALADRVRSEPLRRRALWRTAFATGFTLLLILAFAMTGGIGYAASAVKGGTTAVTSLVTATATSETLATQQQSSVSGAALQSSSSEDNEGSEGDDDESNGDEEEDDDGPADDQYEEDVLICHHRPNGETRTIEVDADEVQGHLDHGDTLGPCPDEDDDEEDDD